MPAPPSLCSGNTNGAPIATIAITGTHNRNVARQVNTSSSSPESSGPSATPTEMLAAHAPIAIPRCLGLKNIEKISPSVAGMTAAAAIPSTARQKIIQPGSPAYAARNETTANTPEPMVNTSRRPTRSPNVPMATRKPAMRKP